MNVELFLDPEVDMYDNGVFQWDSLDGETVVGTYSVSSLRISQMFAAWRVGCPSVPIRIVRLLLVWLLRPPMA